VLYKRFAHWAKKKYDISKKELYLEHLTSFNSFFKFKPLPLDIPALKKGNSSNFENVNKQKEAIFDYCDTLTPRSGVYMFYLTHKPLHFYIGKAEDLNRRIIAHIKQREQESRG
jgi:hypothetical protein